MILETVNVARDFSVFPGGRYKTDGPKSGEEFRKEHLLKWFSADVPADGVVVLEMDGTKGYAPSFIDEVFGALARVYGPERVRQRLDIRFTDFPWQMERIVRKIDNPDSA